MIAIDPGPEKSAVIRVHSTAGPAWTVQPSIAYAAIIPNPAVLAFLQNHWAEPVAIEMIENFGMAVGKDIFETCVWIGRFIQAHGGQYRKVTRMEVKMHVCHDSKAKDSNIRQALVDRFGQVGTKKAKGPLYGIKKDLWSALAICVTAAETSGKWSTR